MAGKVRLLGGKLDGSQPLQGVAGTNVLLGTATFARLPHNTPTFSVGLARATAFASFGSTNSTVLDGSGITFTGVSPDPNDTKLVGIPDAWQSKYFSSVGKIWWSDDPDGDGSAICKSIKRTPTRPTGLLSWG